MSIGVEQLFCITLLDICYQQFTNILVNKIKHLKICKEPLGLSLLNNGTFTKSYTKKIKSTIKSQNQTVPNFMYKDFKFSVMTTHTFVCVDNDREMATYVVSVWHHGSSLISKKKWTGTVLKNLYIFRCCSGIGN